MRIDFDQAADHRIAAKDLRRAFLNDPINLDIGELSSNRRQRRQRVNNIANGSELYEQDPHVTSMLPKKARFVRTRIIWKWKRQLSYPKDCGFYPPSILPVVCKSLKEA